MVNIGELENYLSPKCCQSGDIVEVITEGEIKEQETKFGLKNILTIPVKLNGVNKLWSPGRPARDQMSQLCKSTNTKDWVGKKFSVVIVDNKVIPGQLV